MKVRTGSPKHKVVKFTVGYTHRIGKSIKAVPHNTTGLSVRSKIHATWPAGFGFGFHWIHDVG